MSLDIVWLDCEATGADPDNDRIVQMCFHRQGGRTFSTLVNPERPIPAEATEIHKITDADVAGAPPFRHFAAQLQRQLQGVVLAGYNNRRFDTVLLDTELRRAGQPGLARGEDGRFALVELDLYSLLQALEPRTLVVTAKRFAGVDLENAHDAEADTLVLPKVFAGMVSFFGLQDRSIEDLCALSIPEGEIDRDGKFRRRADGVVVYNFGDKRGTPVAEDIGLARWMLKKDFPEESKQVARELIEAVYAAQRDPQPQTQDAQGVLV